MKSKIALIAAAAVVLVSCATSDTTVTAPDGTVTHSVTKSTDAAAIASTSQAAANAALLLAQLKGGK